MAEWKRGNGDTGRPYIFSEEVQNRSGDVQSANTPGGGSRYISL